MRIFGKKKKAGNSEFTLVQVQESGKYDFFSALAKALLLFLLTYGALGGFLSAFSLEYNNGLCMLAIFVLALLLSAVYETDKRWLKNLTSILYFAAYAYLAVSCYRLINSGFFAIINRLYEVSRQYLNVSDGMEYVLNTDDTYLMITMFALFFGMMQIILLNIMLQNKCSLLKIVVLTLLPYVIPFYLDCSPDMIYMLFLLAGYLTAAILRDGNVKEQLSKQMRYVLPLTVVLTVVVVRIVSFILPENQYQIIVPKNALKEASEEDMVQFAQYGLMALFRRSSITAGVSGGMLSKGAILIPTYETVLKVRYTPYDYQPVYLKAFTGKSYLGDRWTPAGNKLIDDVQMWSSLYSRIQSFYDLTDEQPYQPGKLQGRGIMEVEKLDEDDGYEYVPYYTDTDLTTVDGAVSAYTYYPAVSQISGITDRVSDDYLEVPRRCRNAVARICRDANFSGTEEEIAAQIVKFFQDNYFYTLRPGFYFGNSDYITHFLLETKRGYCAHFASAATMLFRYVGIPARYVEGYAFSYRDVVETGDLVEDAEYSDYYEGFAPLGETALVELEIPDSYAHAWVEIYVEDKGWIIVDPTPAQTSLDDNTSFWDAFMNGNGDTTNPEMAESNLGAYLEGALGGISYILLGASGLLLIGWCAVLLLRAYREKKLPGQERVRLEYERLLASAGRKHADFQRLRTLEEQLDWISEKSGLEISQEQGAALYRVYFAENADCDCEELCRQLRRMRRKVKYTFILPER